MRSHQMSSDCWWMFHAWFGKGWHRAFTRDRCRLRKQCRDLAAEEGRQQRRTVPLIYSLEGTEWNDSTIGRLDIFQGWNCTKKTMSICFLVRTQWELCEQQVRSSIRPFLPRIARSSQLALKNSSALPPPWFRIPLGTWPCAQNKPGGKPAGMQQLRRPGWHHMSCSGTCPCYTADKPHCPHRKSFATGCMTCQWESQRARDPELELVKNGGHWKISSHLRKRNKLT